MPCFLVVTVLLKDMNLAKKALDELGLQEGKDYVWRGGGVQMFNESKNGVLKQRYALLEAERATRKKGKISKRVTQENGDIQLVIG